MTSERIKEIQEQTAYPESRSVMLALKRVWNECAQEKSYTKEDLEDAYEHGKLGKTFYKKDGTIILPRNYEGVDG